MKKDLIQNKIIYDTPKYLKQKLINQIVENGIGTYKYKSEPNLIQLTNKSTDDKIVECLHKEPITIKLIDLLEISKGYKCTIFFEYSNINIDLIKKEFINIESEYYKNIDDIKPLYLEDEEHIYIKFHSDSSYLCKGENPFWVDVRYVMLFVFHKKFNLFEVRFDEINTYDQKGKYNIFINQCLNFLEKKCELQYKHMRLDNIIRNIIKEYPSVVTELIWSSELTKSQGITLKAGEDFKMPLFDTIKEKIFEWRLKYKDKDDAIDVLDELEMYLDKTKEYADDKFRTLRMVKYLKNGKYIDLEESIDFKVTFNYGGTLFDLINIYQCELNEMERIDYVANLIGDVRRNIK